MSISFDPTKVQFMRTPGSSVYDNLESITVACWIKLKSIGLTDNPVFLWVKNPNNASFVVVPQLAFQGNSGHPTYNAIVGTANATGIPAAGMNSQLPTAVWSHVAYTFDILGDQKVHLYVNGTEVSYFFQETAAGGGLATDDSGDGWYIGSVPPSNPVYGTVNSINADMAEFAVWNVALSSSDIAAVAASTKGVMGVTATNPVGYWHMCGVRNPEPDYSGNGNSMVYSPSAAVPGSACPGYTVCDNPSSNRSCVYIGTYPGNGFTDAFPNPQRLDLIQVVNEGGKVVWNYSYTGVVTLNPPSPTTKTLLLQAEGANFAAAFPNPQQYDMLHIINRSGKIVYIMDYLGNTFSL